MCFASYVYWNLSPEVFRLGPLGIRWDGLFFAILFAVGMLIVRWQFRAEHKDETSLEKLPLYLMAGNRPMAQHPFHCVWSGVALTSDQGAQVTRVIPNPCDLVNDGVSISECRPFCS